MMSLPPPGANGTMKRIGLTGYCCACSVIQGAHKAQEFADSDRFETLRALSFFSAFSDAELWEVARISTWRHADAGQTLMKEGEPGADFCILAEGEAKVTRRGKLLGVVRAGE